MSGSVFRNEDMLSTDFLPSAMPFRESQIKQVASNMEPVAEGRRGQNTFIFGSPGIGKTATVKFVFRMFEEEYPSVKAVYVNCWDFNTSIAVMSKITNELGVFITRRGIGKDEVSQRFTEAMSKWKGGVVVCLDEVDQLVNKDPGALYNLLRSRDITGKDVTLVMISNDPHVFSKVESRVTSSLSSDEIEFRPYDISEMKSILSERARLAFSSAEPSGILLAANQAVKMGGDVRVGLQCLQKAGRLAQREGAKRLMASHVKGVIKDVSSPRQKVVEGSVNEDERIILDIMKKASPLSFLELHARYSKMSENPAGVRMVQNYVNHLVESGALRLSERKVGGKRMIYRV